MSQKITENTLNLHKILFINTFEPVSPLYKSVLPECRRKGLHCVALVSQGIYRGAANGNSCHLLDYLEFIYVPSLLRKRKRWAVVFYWLMAPFRLFFSPGAMHIFLTSPPLFYIMGSAISRIKKIPYIIHIMDFYPHLFVEMGLLSRKNLFYRVLSRLSGKALRKADGIIVLGRCMKNLVISKGIDKSKIRVFTNWANENIRPIEREDNKFRQANHLEDKFVVMYSGNMGMGHDLSTLLKSAELLEDHSDIVFVFIGQGSKRKAIIQAVESGKRNIRIFDYQSEEMLPHSLSAADVHFMSLRKGFEGLMVPSKFYGVLAAGRPVFFEGPPSSEVALAINEIGCGKIITRGDYQALSDTILHYYKLSIADQEGIRAWNAYQTFYRPDIIAGAYVEYISGILRNSGKVDKKNVMEG